MWSPDCGEQTAFLNKKIKKERKKEDESQALAELIKLVFCVQRVQ